jgi:endonuclease YncB( thermonuclease family)
MTMRVIAALLLLMLATPAAAEDLFYSGPVTRVADGDTFTIESEGKHVRVRFCGVDSPERKQPGYSEASTALGRLTEGQEVRCVQVGGGTPCDGRPGSHPTSRDRIVAQCFVEGKDIAMEMVCSGNAKDWPKFSGGYYAVCKR